MQGVRNVRYTFIDTHTTGKGKGREEKGREVPGREGKWKGSGWEMKEKGNKN